MPNYQRNRVYGGIYFFTLVTHDRKEFFADHAVVDKLLAVLKRVQKRKPFELIAYCVLPDHVHLLIQLPENARDFSQLVRDIKRSTTIEVKKFLKQKEIKLWQNRFWEHTIQDQQDLQRHFDYIHYNPVKHGYVQDYAQWKWSSYDLYFDNKEDTKKINPGLFEKDYQLFGE